jgi:hypothetical protein
VLLVAAMLQAYANARNAVKPANVPFSMPKENQRNLKNLPAVDQRLNNLLPLELNHVAKEEHVNAVKIVLALTAVVRNVLKSNRKHLAAKEVLATVVKTVPVPIAPATNAPRNNKKHLAVKEEHVTVEKTAPALIVPVTNAPTNNKKLDYANTGETLPFYIKRSLL